jgi:hypothetical protein
MIEIKLEEHRPSKSAWRLKAMHAAMLNYVSAS